LRLAVALDLVALDLVAQAISLCLIKHRSQAISLCLIKHRSQANSLCYNVAFDCFKFDVSPLTFDIFAIAN
jgi:hypothetical protein